MANMIIGIDAHYLEGQPTGPGRYLLNLLRVWNNFRPSFDLKFILYFKSEIPSTLPESPFFIKKILYPPLGLQSNALFLQYLLPKAAKKDKVDVLFCPGYAGPLNFPGKIALALHDIIYEARPDLYNWPSFLDKILLKKVSKKLAQKAKIIFTISQFSKKEIIKHYKIDAQKIFITYLAPDPKFKVIQNNENIKKIKDKYKIKDKFIFYLGAIIDRRHLQETIKAFEKIDKNFPNFQFLIAGPNLSSFNIKNLVNDINKNLEREAIIYHPYASEKDLVYLYNGAELTCWLSQYEGFGLPLLESMACGTPVITTPLASIPEVVGNCAIFVKEPTNISEISLAMEKGIKDDVLREKLKEKGLEWVKNFSWQKCAEKTLSVLLNP